MNRPASSGPAPPWRLVEGEATTVGTGGLAAGATGSGDGLGLGSSAISVMRGCLCPTVPDIRIVTVLQNLSNFIHQLDILARLCATVRLPKARPLAQERR